MLQINGRSFTGNTHAIKYIWCCLSLIENIDFLLSLSLYLCVYFSLSAQFTNIKDSDIQQLQQKLEVCLAKIRPNAIGIVDGFDIPDHILCSALGAYDGNVYERLFAEAQKSPLNQEPVNKSFHLYLKPFMKSNL